MLRKNNMNRGLVFVEMLVVIALIGLFLSIVATSLAETKKQARDSVRILNVQEFRKALSLYHLENNHFPVSKKATVIDGTDVISMALESENLLAEVPRDPLHPTYRYYYVSTPRGTNYILTYCMETGIFDNRVQGCGNTIEP